MMLVEQSTIPVSALPVAEFKDHLRLGTGFADDGIQDTMLEGQLRAALAAIEARTGKILIQRDFLWTVNAWRDFAKQALPVAPAAPPMPWASIRSPAFALAKAVKGGRPRIEAVAPVKSIDPPPAGTIRFAASRPTRNPPKQTTRQQLSKNSSVISSKGEAMLLPAL